MNPPQLTQRPAQRRHFLQEVANELGFNNTEPGTGCSDADAVYLEIKPERPKGPGRKGFLADLQKLIQPDGAIGCFGYELREGSPWLAVWFYCGNPAAMKAVSERLTLGGRNKALIEEAAWHPNDLWVGIPAGRKNGDGDREWFLGVFRAVLGG